MAADPQHSVDRAAAAEELSARPVNNTVLHARVTLRAVLPVAVRQLYLAKAQRGRHISLGWGGVSKQESVIKDTNPDIVAAGLKKKNAHGRVLAQARSEHGARAAAANNHIYSRGKVVSGDEGATLAMRSKTYNRTRPIRHGGSL